LKCQAVMQDDLRCETLMTIQANDMSSAKADK
jgi:hypothetical protein